MTEKMKALYGGTKFTKNAAHKCADTVVFARKIFLNNFFSNSSKDNSKIKINFMFSNLRGSIPLRAKGVGR